MIGVSLLFLSAGIYIYMLIPRKLYSVLCNAFSVYFVFPIAVGLRTL